MLAFVWVDRDRRYFISNCSSLEEGEPHIRFRWRQGEDTTSDPERLQLSIPTPKVCNIYYNACGAIDQSNRHRQDNLQLERKVETKNWATRVGITILGMCIVDTWLVYKLATNTSELQADFYARLAEELIDNTYDEGRPRRHSPTEAPQALYDLSGTGIGRAGLGAHLTPTKRKRTCKDGTIMQKQLRQGWCIVCASKYKGRGMGNGFKTSYLCSLCNDEAIHTAGAGIESKAWLCHSRTMRNCFAEHMASAHTSTT
jgi:hypothetical protein